MKGLNASEPMSLDVNNSDDIFTYIRYVGSGDGRPARPRGEAAWAGGLHSLQSNRRVRGESSLTVKCQKFCEIVTWLYVSLDKYFTH